MILLDGVDDDAVSGTAHTFSAGRRARTEAIRTVFCFATSFDGATVSLELSPDNETTWIVARNAETGAAATFSDAGAAGFVMSVRINGTHIRGRVSGGGGSVDSITLRVH